jgi:hypothetical protein
MRPCGPRSPAPEGGPVKIPAGVPISSEGVFRVYAVDRRVPAAAEDGYTIALDDFVPDSPAEAFLPFASS